jgi:hypothetical protein
LSRFHGIENKELGSENAVLTSTVVAVKKRKSTRAKQTRQQIFLRLYAMYGNLTTAATGAQVDVRAHYKWLEEEEYRQAFERAHETAVDLLEAEARRRAVEGDEEPVIYQGGLCYEKLPGGKKKQIVLKRRSDNLLMFLLKSKRPEVYRDTWKGELKTTAIVSRGPDLSRLTDADLDYLERIAEHVSVSTAVASIAGSGSDPGGEDPEST